MENNMWNWVRMIGGIFAIIFIVRFVLKSPFKDAGLVENVILKYVGSTPFGLLMSLLIGIGLTCLVHSSSLTTVTMIALVASNVVPVHAGIAFIMGANIGTTIDAFIMTWVFPQHEAQMVAWSHIAFNLIGTSIMFPLFLLVRHWIK
jgi:phosphate:Na+ symporter